MAHTHELFCSCMQVFRMMDNIEKEYSSFFEVKEQCARKGTRAEQHYLDNNKTVSIFGH